MKNNFWTFSDEQKSMFVAQTSERVGLPPQAVEKDWWVTMTLKALFESSCRDFITFKGEPSFNKNGTLYIYADKDSFLYQVVDGELKAVDAEYDEDYEAWEFKTRKLTAYAISDVELDE